jgi:hypothetical protein
MIDVLAVDEYLSHGDECHEDIYMQTITPL